MVHNQWYKLPLEIFQQINWLILKPINYENLDRKNIKVPIFFYFLACRLNCFTKKELESWMVLGDMNWDQISTKIPFLLSGYFHKKRHSKNNNNYKKDISIIENKDILYEITPYQWKPNYLVYDCDKRKLIKKSRGKSWVVNSLTKQGIITKPVNGSGGKDVYRFQVLKESLYREKLFTQKLEFIQNLSYPLEEVQILNLISRNLKNKFILTPYIKANREMPNSCYTPVLRVITINRGKNKFEILSSWIEISLFGKFVCINNSGYLTFSEKKNLSSSQQSLLSKWIDFISFNKFDMFKSCYKGSLFMHKKIPEIDQVAWDWIPSEKKPTLLEGNAFFSLLELQQLLYLRGLLYY